MEKVRTDATTEHEITASERIEKLAELSKLAIGSRTLKKFAVQSGLSEGFLSRLTTGKLKSLPSRRSLIKLTAETSRPQNGITLYALMHAAGYKYTAPLPEQKKEFLQSDGEALPAEVLTAAFPSYLTAATLEGNGQLSSFSSKNQREMFILQAKGQKIIVGIPAFCALNGVEDEIKRAKWNVMMAMSIFGAESKDAFFLILTNQPALYEDFDKIRLVSTKGEFYIALTEDFKTFIRQRQVKTTDIYGEPEFPIQKNPTYNLMWSDSAVS